MKHKPVIKSYQQAKEFLGDKKERPYAHNTRIEIDSLNLGHDVISVKYHGNTVVNFYPDGAISINNCGCETLTTKERLNWFIPDGFSVYQEKYVWYLRKYHVSDEWGAIEDGIWQFENLMTIKNGEVYLP